MVFQYYTAIMAIIICSMLVLQYCITKSNTMNLERIILFRWLFWAIIIASLGEWLGVYLDGAANGTRVLHILVKETELSVAPCIAFIFSWILDKKWMKETIIFLIAQAILEFASGIFGFIYYVDDNNIYCHGSFYWIYVLAYAISLVYSVAVVTKNMTRFQYNGKNILVMIAAIALAGALIQMFDSDIKVSYASLGVASAMLYIITLEMVQQTDALTGLLNRLGFENHIVRNTEECVIIFFDVDNFKTLNDTYGHAFGDTVLMEIGEVIRQQYFHYGKCFRYGGDEFCAVLTKGLDILDEINQCFLDAISDLNKKDDRMPSVSIGYALFRPDKETMQEAIKEADKMMYEYKAAHKIGR